MTQYIEIPIETDPEALAQEAFELIASRFPGWVPNDGNIETVLVEALARMTAEARDAASAVPTDIFRFMGELVAVLPLEPTPATATTDWVMINTAGYTIPEGTQVGIRTAGDELVPFLVDTDIVIPPGSSSASDVPIHAVEEGSEGSGLTGTVELIDTLDFVSSITLDPPTTGGSDGETTDEYINRLANRLQLLSPRPILARDFAIFAQDIAGVDRAVAIDNLIPGTNEIQTVTITGSPTGGNFKLTFNTQTADIPYNANAATVQAALEALASVEVGDVAVAGGPGPGTPYTVTFKGQYTETNVTQMTASHTFTGGSSPAIAVTTTTGGAAPTTNAEKAVAVAVVDSLGEPVSSVIRNEVDAYLQARRETNFIVSVIDPNYTIIDVNFTATSMPGTNAADVELAAEQAVQAYLSPANWGLPTGDTGETTAPEWINDTTVRYLELATVINNVPGINYITALTFRKGSNAFAQTDVTLNGSIPLPRPGTIAGTVT